MKEEARQDKESERTGFFLLELNSTLYYITIIFPARSLLMQASPFFLSYSLSAPHTK